MFTIVHTKVFLHMPLVAVRTVVTSQLFNVSFSLPALFCPFSTLAMTPTCLGSNIFLSISSALLNSLSQQQMNESYAKISYTNGVNRRIKQLIQY